jgi:hypothetical protein
MDRSLQLTRTDTNGRGFKQRIQHRCGRFLAELKNGRLYVMCARCKTLVVIDVQNAYKELRITVE